jgi:DNA-binding response OmpR family regulator
MARDTYALMISDIVMPEKNGLELLKLVKKEWPLTKALMMTAYASPDTAVKAIRLGALDYIPKPFTPDELRQTVDKALSGKLVEARVAEDEKEMIEVIDLDMPFETDEVAKVTGDDYVNMLGRSDMPVVEVKLPEPLENYCEVGDMVCDIFRKLGATCKAGNKTAACPQKKAKKGKSAKGKRQDTRQLIGVDQPFNYEEVVGVTGPEYVQHLHQDGVSFLPYEELKERMAATARQGRRTIDVDMPFDREEVAAATGERYARELSRSDMPAVEITASEPLENFCETGDMVCDIFKKLGATCKAGTKTGACPQKKAKKGKTARVKQRDLTKLIGIDQPFDIEEVTAVAGPDYLNYLHHESSLVRPYEELKAAYQDGSLGPAADRAAAPAGHQVLVIDDEVAVNNNIRKILEKKGIPVDQAFTKTEALEKIGSGNFSLVLLDLRIPDVRGLELLEAIRARDENTKVIIITGYASVETAVECARMGAVDYLPKPFTPAEIRTAAESAFQLAA